MRRKRLLFILILLLILIPVGRMAYAYNHVTDYTLYEPFSGKIFRMDPADVTRISLASAQTCKEIVYTEPQQISQIVDVLNDLRYHSWHIDPNEIPLLASGGGDWFLRLSFSNGVRRTYRISYSGITMEGMCYKISKDQMAPLMDPLQ